MTSSTDHTVTFSQLVAEFTVDKETLGKQDPYVVFQSGHAKAQTKAIKNNGTATAEWRETYTLEKFTPSSSSVLEVTVYNHNTLLPDSQIGSGTVDLSTLGGSSLSGSGEPITVQLTDKKGKSVGTLRFVVNGGGYSGRGTTSGTGTHSGVGSGVGTAAGAGAAGGTIVGAGKGTNQSVAQQASDKAARLGHDTQVRSGSETGTGRPVGTAIGTGLTEGHQHGHHDHHHGHTHGTGVGTGHHHDSSRAVGTGVGTGHHHDSSRAVGTGVGTGHHHDSSRAVGTGTTGEQVIDRKYYTGTEERAQDQALIEQYREHNPYAKDYETTVQHTGRERLVGSNIEALGTRERVIGQDHHVHSHPTAEIARNLPEGAIETRPGGEGWVQKQAGPICDTNSFSVTGDRTVDKERVTDLREHREFEKEFEVKTKLLGERQLDRGTGAKNVDQNLQSEILNRERVLVNADDGVACAGHPEVGPQNAGTGTGVGGTRGVTGTGTGTGSGRTTGEKIAGAIPGSEENREKKGLSTGTPGNATTGEKVASVIPGSEENREKKLQQGRV